MKKFELRYLITFFFLTTTLALKLTQEKSVKLIIEIFRHGARREEQAVPVNITGNSNPYDDKAIGLGDLTTVGMHAHYFLGKTLRQNYPSLFSSQFDSQKVQIIASNYNRTIVSAQSQFQGIFDLGSGKNITFDQKEFYEPPIKNFNIPWTFGNTALPNRISFSGIENASKKHNLIFVPDTNDGCPKLVKELDLRLEELNEKYSYYFEPLFILLKANGFDPKKYAKKDSYDIESGLTVCDFIIANSWSNPDFQVPPLLLEDCLTLAAWAEFKFTMTIQNFQTYVSKLNRKIVDVLNEYAGGKNKELTAFFLSGHDSTIAQFLLNFYPDNADCIIDYYQNGAGIFDFNSKRYNELPCIERIKFTSNLIIELLEEENNSNVFWISMKYNGNALELKENKTEITLKEFSDILEENIDENFNFNCNDIDENSGLRFLKIALFISIMLLIFALTLLSKTIVALNKKQNRIKIMDQFEGLHTNQENESYLAL